MSACSDFKKIKKGETRWHACLTAQVDEDDMRHGSEDVTTRIYDKTITDEVQT